MSIYRKKLIEVALPLEEINIASAREKSIRHGHPSTLHLWWARRPLATCRAVLFSSIIDDPGEEGVPQELLDRIDALPVPTRTTKVEVPVKKKNGKEGTKFMTKQLPMFPREEWDRMPLVDQRRRRLFGFIDQLVQWENSNDPATLQTAKELIHAATGGNPPPVLDPFCGGGSIPLEAQRLGLEAHGSDLNPVAVLITKAMIEIPPKFADQSPINPESRANGLGTWQGAQGLAEDVRYYGRWMRDEAEKRIGHLYPKVKAYRDPNTGAYCGQTEVDQMWADQNRLVETRDLLFTHPSKLIEEELTVIAWLWARTVPSPDPAARGLYIPLVRSFVLCSKEGKEAWVEPVVGSSKDTYQFEIRTSKSDCIFKPQAGTVGKLGGRCILTGAPLNTKYVRQQAALGNMSSRLLAVVADGPGGRLYLPPSWIESTIISEDLVRMIDEVSDTALAPSTPEKLTGGTCYGYGLDTWAKLFTDRQLVALTTFSDLVTEAREKAGTDALAANKTPAQAKEYADAVAT